MKSAMAAFLLTAFIVVLSLVFKVQTAQASGTIYIRGDGSIDPQTTSIFTTDNFTYTFTGNINDSIEVERDSIVIDGQGYTIQVASGTGIALEGRNNVTIKNIGIRLSKSPNFGVFLDHASNNTICGNDITVSDIGIGLQNNSTGNRIHGNDITKGKFGPGIYLYQYSSNNVISGNTIADNVGGIVFTDGNSNNTVIGNNIVNNRGYNIPGIMLGMSSGNSIIGNNIANNSYHGVEFLSSSDNIMVGNNIVDNGFYGLRLGGSSNNSIVGNNISNNQCGIYLYASGDNRIFHNNLINNTSQILEEGMFFSTNVWDNGLEGNYWSNYTCQDLNYDGICDNPYVMDSNDTDRYPLMGMFSEFDLAPYGKTENVTIISNSTVANLSLLTWLTSPTAVFQPGQSFVQFTATGENGGVGFCRLMIPRTVLNSSSYIVLVDSQPVNATELILSNSTHVYLYFTYTHSTHEVIVTIPEFSPLFMLLLFMIVTVPAVMVFRKQHYATQKSSRSIVWCVCGKVLSNQSM